MSFVSGHGLGALVTTQFTRIIDCQFLPSLMQLKLGLSKEWEGVSEPNTYNPVSSFPTEKRKTKKQCWPAVGGIKACTAAPQAFGTCLFWEDRSYSFLQLWRTMLTRKPSFWITIHRKIHFASNTCHQQ